ncbi:hypothetical protein UPYG_G00025620 [Umbra pygmaea]|uniref:Uncharacterized protein n=1 Tax=Umbra pygmaea TaxID=75934 RepID=A0ABD0Y5R7_UMBPY
MRQIGDRKCLVRQHPYIKLVACTSPPPSLQQSFLSRCNKRSLNRKHSDLPSHLHQAPSESRKPGTKI